MAKYENNCDMKIISDCYVKPKIELNQWKTPHYLSSIDLFFLSKYYAHTGLLYAKPTSWSSSSSLSLSSSFNINTFVDKLKQSLSLALVEFYPLSGRLETVKYPEEHSSWVYVDCNKGPGARFIHATISEQSKLTLSNIVTGYESISRFMWCLFDAGDPTNVINHDGHSRSLLCVQVTELVDGVFIGFTMNHCLGDGVSIRLFINAFSKIFMNLLNNNNNNNNNDDNYFITNIEKPIFKAVFSDGYGPIIKLPYMDPSEIIVRTEACPRLRIRIFNFSAESIATLKAQANRKSDAIISSFQALSAFLWISITRARNRPHDSDTNCILTADTRPKHDPPFSPNHFGNFVKALFATSKVDDLMSNGLGRASALLNKAVTGLDSKAVRAHLKASDEAPHVARRSAVSPNFAHIPTLMFTSSMRFNVYGPEFGLGKPVATRPWHSNWADGVIVVQPGREGGSSASLNVCLLSKVMDSLERDAEFMSYVS